MEAALYRAEEVASRLPLLLKVYKRRYSAEDPFAKSLIREGKRVASFVHPNLVSVYDAGLERGCLYVATQPVDGETLLEGIVAGGLTAARTIALLAPLAEALDAVHAAGLLHGEITPGRIRIDAGGAPRLDALGVARRASADSGIAGVRLADIGYASPELRGGRRMTGASDVYALTAVLAHCLTGEAPFPKDSGTGARLGTRLGARLGARLWRGRWHRSRGPAGALEAVIARGMANDPARRYAHAQALIGAAASALAASGPTRPVERASRRRVSAALLACGCLALAAVALSELGVTGKRAMTAPKAAGVHTVSTTPSTVRDQQPLRLDRRTPPLRPRGRRRVRQVPMPPSPASPAPASTPAPAHAPASASTTGPVQSLPSAPVTAQTVAPASAPAPVISSPPPAATPSSTPAPATVVVVPTGSGTLSTKQPQTSTVVVVPTG
jgi:serine/threonine-protein kinase